MIENCPNCERRRKRMKVVSRLFEIAAVVLIIIGLCYLLLRGIPNVKESAVRMKISNDLKQLGLAMHNYHDAKGTLPAANEPHLDPKGSGQKYPVSWRVLILPYAEHEKLFNEYRYDEPWDGTNNIGFLARMPAFLRHPKAESEHTPPGYTHYRVIVSRADAKPSALFTDGVPGPKLTDIPDGMANTIMIVEAEEAVPWTMPEVLLYDRNQPLPKLGFLHRRYFLAALADGSVRCFSTEIQEEKLRAWITKDGGEPVDDN